MNTEGSAVLVSLHAHIWKIKNKRNGDGGTQVPIHWSLMAKEVTHGHWWTLVVKALTED